jgi:hypothetical protein
MLYKFQKNQISPKHEKYISEMTMEEFFNALTCDQDMRNIIIKIFKQSQFTSAYWQFPIYCQQTKNTQIQFDLYYTTPFRPADPSDFAGQFIGKNMGDIIMFKNKSGDTDLISIVPTNDNEYDIYFSDIMNFMKNSHPSFQHALLKKIGVEMLKKTSPCYLSTHGKGVDWIHIRLCNKPKYYVT